MDKLFSTIQQTLQQNNQNDLLKKQQTSLDKLNELLEQSTKDLLCGPSCQQLKVAEELKQKYLDAQTNVKKAPKELVTTKKNYYVFTQGDAYYDNMLEEELNKKAKKITQSLSDNFTDELTGAITMNQYLNTALINSSYTQDLLNHYIEHNKELKLKLRNNHGDILTNDRKTYYETQALERLESWYKLWWYIYYILFISFLLWCVLTPSGFSWITKVIMGILILFYPYYIDYILRRIYSFFMGFYKNIPKNVYNDL